VTSSFLLKEILFLFSILIVGENMNEIINDFVIWPLLMAKLLKVFVA